MKTPTSPTSPSILGRRRVAAPLLLALGLGGVGAGCPRPSSPPPPEVLAPGWVAGSGGSAPDLSAGLARCEEARSEAGARARAAEARNRELEAALRRSEDRVKLLEARIEALKAVDLEGGP